MSSWSNEVWLVIDSLTFGGIETHVLELAKGLKQHKVAVKVLLLKHYQTTPLLVDKLRSAEIPVIFLDSHQHYLSTLYRAVRQHKPALLHAHGYKASLICKLIKLLTGVRQFSTYHAGETPSGKVWLYDWLDRYTAFVSNNAIVVSEKIAQKVRSNTLMFNNFIDTSALDLSTGSQVAFVGRLSHEKGPDRFIELAKRHPKLTFDVYGSGPLEKALITQSSSNIRFNGHQNDMQNVWKKIGILVICSRFEGLPMTALEAMARGITVLSLNIGNLPKLIQHNSNGYLAKDLEELSNVLTYHLNLDSKCTAELQRLAIETITQHYSQSAVIPQLLKLYFPFQTDCQFEN